MKGIPVWIVGLIVLAFLVITFAFGVIVRDASFGHFRLGAVSKFAWKVSSLPAEAARALRMISQGNSAGMATLRSDRFPGQSGWTFFAAGVESGLDGYLLFSRYDGDVGHSVIELVDLKAGEVLHRIDLDAEALLANAEKKTDFADPENWRNARFQAIHPIATEDGDIIAKGFRAPLFRMTPCGKTVWVYDQTMLHHTIERGPDGNFWSSNYIDPQRVDGLRGDFWDPGIFEFNADGEILFERSFTQVMLDHGLGGMILAGRKFDVDPIHLNDVQPVLEDGPYWRKGDLFLSIRNISTIVLYRPSTDKIIWWKQGPWVAQHDVDVIDQTTISVFNNNSFDFGSGTFVDGRSDIVFYDFATDTVYSPYAASLAEQELMSEGEGLFTKLPDGHYIVEESLSARVMIFTPAGDLAAQHINRASNGLTYALGWSRYMDRASGDQLLKNFRAADCTN